MRRLETIGQALYMRLFFHFANLHDGKSGKRFVFPKRYDDICNEWLGGLTVLPHKSRIITEQLGSPAKGVSAPGEMSPMSHQEK
jgi:hypothetical protein